MLPNPLQNGLRLLQHLMIPKAQDGQPPGAQKLVPGRVIGTTLRMLPAVELYDQTMLIAIEIQDVATDRMLAAEFRVGQATTAQEVPDQLLGVGGGLAQVARVFEQVGGEPGGRAGRKTLTPNPSPACGRGERMVLPAPAGGR